MGLRLVYSLHKGFAFNCWPGKRIQAIYICIYIVCIDPYLDGLGFRVQGPPQGGSLWVVGPLQPRPPNVPLISDLCALFRGASGLLEGSRVVFESPIQLPH